MKLTIAPADLKTALDVARPLAKNGRVLPVLGMVLLDASVDGGLTITGTDLETRAWRTVNARVDEPGLVCLPPSGLVDFLAVCPSNGGIALSVNDKHKAELVCGRAQIKLAGLDPESYPAATSFDDPSLDLTISAATLAELLGAVVHAVAPDRSREVLAGILVQVRDGRLTLAAADGYRLAVAAADVEDVPDLSLIPLGAALGSLRGALAQSSSVRLAVDSRTTALLVDCEAGSWSVRLIEGQFPDFNRIIPRDAPTRITVAREPFAKASKLMQGIEHTATGDIVRLTVGENTVRVRASDAAGDHEAEVELDAAVEGKAVLVSFNSKYLSEACGALTSDTVVLELGGPASPTAIVSPDSRDNVQVVMPMHVAR